MIFFGQELNCIPNNHNLFIRIIFLQIAISINNFIFLLSDGGRTIEKLATIFEKKLISIEKIIF